MAYSEKVIDHYENPRNVGKMDTGDVNVGTGMVGAPACGDVMKLQIRVEDGIIRARAWSRSGSRVKRWTRLQQLRTLKLHRNSVSRRLRFIVRSLRRTLLRRP
jgi:hypothetical protein